MVLIFPFDMNPDILVIPWGHLGVHVEVFGLPLHPCCGWFVDLFDAVLSVGNLHDLPILLFPFDIVDVCGSSCLREVLFGSRLQRTWWFSRISVLAVCILGRVKCSSDRVIFGNFLIIVNPRLCHRYWWFFFVAGNLHWDLGIRTNVWLWTSIGLNKSFEWMQSRVQQLAVGGLLIPFERLYGVTLQSNSNTHSWIAGTIMTCIHKKNGVAKTLGTHAVTMLHCYPYISVANVLLFS